MQKQHMLREAINNVLSAFFLEGLGTVGPQYNDFLVHIIVCLSICDQTNTFLVQ